MLTLATMPGYKEYANRTIVPRQTPVAVQYSAFAGLGNVVAYLGLWGKKRAAFPLHDTWQWSGSADVFSEGATFNENDSRVTIAASSTITNTGATTITSNSGTADLVLNPGSAVTGFPPGTISGTQHVDDAFAIQFDIEALAVYNDLAGRTTPTPIILPTNAAGMTLTSGIYKSASSLLISGGNLTLNAQGNPNAVFIFQLGSTLTMNPGTSIILANGALARNVYWQVGSSATIGVGSVAKGLIVANTSITLNTGASLTGRAWALNGAVTLDTNAVVLDFTP